MTIQTLNTDWQKVQSTNSTDGSFDSLVATATEPTGDGVISWSGVMYGADAAANTILLMPYGVGAENTTFSMRLTGWDVVSSLWVPTPIAEFACTIGTAVGVAANAILNTENFVDTITKTAGPSTVETMSFADNRQAWVMLDAMGHRKLQVTFDMTGATSGNALYKRL